MKNSDERFETMRIKFKPIAFFLLLLLLLIPVQVYAQLFGADDEDLAKIEFELKKFNAHLEELKSNQILSLKQQQEDLSRQIEEIKQILPQLLGAVDVNKQETLNVLDRTNAKIKDLEAEVKNQVLDELQKQNKALELFREGQKNLKEALKQDMEMLGNSSRSNFQSFSEANKETLVKVVQQLEVQSATTKKGFDGTISLFRKDVIPAMVKENQKNQKMVREHLFEAKRETLQNLEAFSVKNQSLNQKLIEILKDSLKQGVNAKELLTSITKDIGATHAGLENAHQSIIVNKSMMVETQKALGKSQKTLNETNKSLTITDEKLGKLIELSAELAVHSTELENSVVGQLKESAQKESEKNAKVDLANEKLSRLIEILKSIAKEQTKIDPLATTLSTMQKEQEVLQKAQSDIMKEQKAIRKLLADLRRKANVNISRNEEIKKTLGQLKPSKSLETGN